MTRILIADDHAVVRHGVRSLVQDALPGAEITEAANAREALERLGRDACDLVLLDINMPGRDGFEVLEEIHRLHASTRVLVLTAFPEQEFALRAVQLGAAGFLNKQTGAEELLLAVRRILDGGRYVTVSLAEKLAATLGGEVCVQPHEALSARELQVLQLIARGRSLKDISAELNLSEKTIGTYRARISQKMGMGSKVELTRYALQHKLVE